MEIKMEEGAKKDQHITLNTPTQIVASDPVKRLKAKNTFIESYQNDEIAAHKAQISLPAPITEATTRNTIVSFSSGVQ
ncbi:hypothetical protein AYI68_g3980 [Smittium mucronatum]|uniref:Uncharacterized protein n=1 Tax=Smittium mucronatum TaxID=133383 RepID=A0A1R0GYJ2_9FUNG|nr:hypothetical protein AYI68_g3980 [Smittium mucronatum]